MRADNENSLAAWGIARFATNGTPLPDRAYMRREVMRIIGGFHMRIVASLMSDVVQLFDMLESNATDEVILRRASHVHHCPCCGSQSSQVFHWSLQTCSVGRLRRLKKVWAPSILRTERDHEGHALRQGGTIGNCLKWRRQVSYYFCRRSRDRWMGGSKQRSSILRRRSNVDARVFQAALVTSERTGNGGVVYVCCISCDAVQEANRHITKTSLPH